MPEYELALLTRGDLPYNKSGKEFVIKIHGTMKRLTDLGELGIIDRFRQRFPVKSRQVVMGIGDDTAILKGERGYYELLTTDILIEDVHFRRSTTPPYFLGRKSLAVNISDIAAMGGEPQYFLISLGSPTELTVDYLDQLMEGMLHEASRWGVSLIGGDTSSSPDRLLINIALWGRVKKREVLTRSGAGVGDSIFVSGKLGSSAMGLKLLQKGYRLQGEEVTLPTGEPQLSEEPYIRECLTSHLSPEPRVELGRAIASHRLASSMIDISDGLSRDLMNICRESRKGAQLLKHRLPISEAVLHLAAAEKDDPYRFALHGGEDYELLFTVPPDRLSKLEKLRAKELPSPVTRIGSITSEEEGFTIVDQEGNRQPLLPGGYEHFVPHKI